MTCGCSSGNGSFGMYIAVDYSKSSAGEGGYSTNVAIDNGVSTAGKSNRRADLGTTCGCM
jgi:hypothetical protein